MKVGRVLELEAMAMRDLFPRALFDVSVGAAYDSWQFPV